MVQILTPFKAYFEYHFNDSTNKLIQKEELERYLSRKSTDGKNVNTEKWVKSYLTGFELSIFKRTFPIPFDARTVHSIEPKNLRVTDSYQNVEFKVNSRPVEIIHLTPEEISFVNDKSEVYTVKTCDNTKLIRL